MKVLLTAAVIACVWVSTAQAHWRPGYHNRVHAIKTYFKADWREAVDVAWCESYLDVWARNGQYLGIFQMGEYERATYGHGRDPWSQAKAAAKYYRASGSDWSRWECKPWWKPAPRRILRGF